MVEVTRIEVDEGDDADGERSEELEEAVDEIEEAIEDAVEDIEDDERRRHRRWGRAWGSLAVGLEMTPFAPDGQIRLGSRRVIANQFPGFPGGNFARAVRGLDLRWGGFGAKDRRDRPKAEGWFRTGYTQGYADFLPIDEAAGFQADDATAMAYLTVPLWFAGNIYAFRRWPVRPYAGAGAGFDVLRVEYARRGRENLVDVSARIGFELHAGLEARINNHIGIFGELRQVWSARRKLAGVPDFSNEGATVIVGVKSGFALRRGRRHDHTHVEVTRTERDSDAEERERGEAQDAREAEEAAEAAEAAEAPEAPEVSDGEGGAAAPEPPAAPSAPEEAAAPAPAPAPPA
jgi:hypothetical protein